ncbi:MAG: hypothetical protein PF692_04780 [Kiritimatiellae bacterium]|jgi:predicted Zn-dependent protease|nr:hypothetical protein [Kiritimatiellia bacterium]
MNKIVILFLVMAALSVGAQEKASDETGVKNKSAKKAEVANALADTKQYNKDQILTLVRVGDVSKKDLSNAKAWIEKSMYPPITVNEKKLKYSKKFEDKSVLFAELNKMKKDNLAIVALVSETPSGVSISNSVNVVGSAGIVYVTPYMTKYAKENPQLELYKWRVNKEALKASALAMGMEKCPFPRCCLSPDYDDARIDSKGRNLCPPCWKKNYQFLISKGIKEPIPPHIKKAMEEKKMKKSAVLSDK